jgi:hypothetical protein
VSQAQGIALVIQFPRKSALGRITRGNPLSHETWPLQNHGKFACFPDVHLWELREPPERAIPRQLRRRSVPDGSRNLVLFQVTRFFWRPEAAESDKSPADLSD